MAHQNHLGEESIGKLLLKYSIPAIIGMMVNALYNIVDRMFIGRIPDVGSLALTGVGITMPIIWHAYRNWINCKYFIKSWAW